jgi:hypothetical protein
MKEIILIFCLFFIDFFTQTRTRGDSKNCWGHKRQGDASSLRIEEEEGGEARAQKKARATVNEDDTSKNQGKENSKNTGKGGSRSDSDSDGDDDGDGDEGENDSGGEWETWLCCLPVKERTRTKTKWKRRKKEVSFPNTLVNPFSFHALPQYVGERGAKIPCQVLATRFARHFRARFGLHLFSIWRQKKM